MPGCSVVPIASSQACSGKCKSRACRTAPRVWVVAACEGIVSLFEKNHNGVLAPMDWGGHAVFPSLGEFQKSIDTAEQTHAFDRLVIIGSGNDIAWIHASLPEPVNRHIAAEIDCPLRASWFKQPLPLPELTQALEGALKI